MVYSGVYIKRVKLMMAFMHRPNASHCKKTIMQLSRLTVRHVVMVASLAGAMPATYLLYTRRWSQRRPQVRLEFDMISVRKNAIYSPKSHDCTQAFFIFNQKGDVCVLSFYIVTHESLIGNHEIRFWYLVCIELISSVVFLSFDVGRRRLTCPFPCPPP